MQAERTPRRTKDGGYVVEVDELRLGGRGRVQWWPILEIEEFPKTRRIRVGVQSTDQTVYVSRMRRTTLVARAPREDEKAASTQALQGAIRRMIDGGATDA